MAAPKKKTAKTKTPAKVSWTDAIKDALAKKKQPTAWPKQPKPRDNVVQKVKKDAF